MTWTYLHPSLNNASSHRKCCRISSTIHYRPDGDWPSPSEQEDRCGLDVILGNAHQHHDRSNVGDVHSPEFLEHDIRLLTTAPARIFTQFLSSAIRKWTIITCGYWEDCLVSCFSDISFSSTSMLFTLCPLAGRP